MPCDTSRWGSRSYSLLFSSLWLIYHLIGESCPVIAENTMRQLYRQLLCSCDGTWPWTPAWSCTAWAFAWHDQQNISSGKEARGSDDELSNLRITNERLSKLKRQQWKIVKTENIRRKTGRSLVEKTRKDSEYIRQKDSSQQEGGTKRTSKSAIQTAA